MCGIVGGWQRGREPGLAARLDTAMPCLAHRGPDDAGRYVAEVPDGIIALGHRRLSIIDLTEGGHQPMHSGDGRLTLVFNGEIYNYRELRAELRAAGLGFRTDSDSEVLLAAWARWGPAVLPRLIGMFAFVVYDRGDASLTVVRDAFGIKPLFYDLGEDHFYFASEMPALLELRAGDPPRLDRQRAYDYLVHGIQESGDRTFVSGVRHLAPAHLLRVELDGRRVPTPSRWWVPGIAERASWGFADAADAVREQFLENVRLHLRSDVPVGAALSGGIDSSAIVCAMRQVEPAMPIHTFSFVPGDLALSEERYIDLVNATVGAHPHKVAPRAEDLAADLPDLLRAQGEPFCTTSMYAQYRVFRAAREAGVPVVLEGQGADEMLAGYEGYPGQRMRSMLERGQLGAMLRFGRGWKAWPGREHRSAWRALAGQMIPDTVYQRSLGIAGVSARPAWLDLAALEGQGVRLRPHRMRRLASGRGRRLVEVLGQALTDTGLPSLLRYGDRNAMRFAVENRVPFLTIPFVELMLSLPESFLVSPEGETKRVFRAAMRGIVPDAILDRRDKIGFETPMRSWLRNSAPMMREHLEGAGRNFDFLDAHGMVEAFERNVAGQSGGDSQVWRMINLGAWSSMFGVR